MMTFDQRRDGWTSEITAEARRLWNLNLSATKIGLAINCTKDTVLGKSHREGWPARQVPGGLETPTSEAQREVMRRLYPTMMSAEKIIEAVNAAGGAFQISTTEQLRGFAKRLKLKRPVEWRIANGQRSCAIRWAAPRATPTAERLPIVIPLREVYQRAAQLGVPLRNRGSIEALNKATRREKPNHPGFVLANATPTRMSWLFR